jgi:imidazolonepropionase-like amidohydrolase
MISTKNGTLTIRHANLVHPDEGNTEADHRIRIVEGRIVSIEPDDSTAIDDAHEFDAAGQYAIPGLIDGHVHAYAAPSAKLGTVRDLSPAYVTAHATQVLSNMLDRGFTTVRDVGGADFGLSAALEEGFIEGPRLMFGGKALSQTGGHGDLRPPGREIQDAHYAVPGLARLCDGISEVRHAARDELRRGADHLKIMISGGCGSPTDRVDSLQFSDEEISAIVAEAAAAKRYCAGHALTAEAVNRGLKLGVRSIEHGNLLDQSSIELFLTHDAFYVPTLITYVAWAEDGERLGLAGDELDKILTVVDQAFDALRMADEAGVSIAFGSDLIGAMHPRQSDEFTLRAKVQTPAAILRSATTVGAKLLQREGELGVLAPGAVGDLLLVRDNPLESVRSLAEPTSGISLVVQSGVVRRDRRSPV